jgi:hypothetical protein
MEERQPGDQSLVWKEERMHVASNNSKCDDT